MNPLLIDAFEFCSSKERREGENAVSDFPRLAVESIGGFGSVHWILQGGVHKLGYPQLTLFVTGSVQLMCQRCLTPFVFNIQSESILTLARTESEADEIDALLDDESAEAVVGSREMKIYDLIEDEALLALPLSPKHDTCPDQLVMERKSAGEKESPFAVLKNLKAPRE